MMASSHLIGPAGLFYLLFFGLLIPWLAFKSGRKLAQHPLPERRTHFLLALLQLSVFSLITLWTARVEKISLFSLPERPFASVVFGLLLLLVALFAMFPQWKRNVIRRERTAYLFMPRTTSEKILWCLIAVLAGFSEEAVYRGVMFTLLFRITGTVWTAILLAAVIFAISHFLQGWTSMAVIFVFALAFHLLVLTTGSLLIAMAVHAIFDLIAGLAYGYFGKRLGYPLEPIAPLEPTGGGTRY
jgi:membrane protease YdiL (CAAX protease family)